MRRYKYKSSELNMPVADRQIKGKFEGMLTFLIRKAGRRARIESSAGKAGKAESLTFTQSFNQQTDQLKYSCSSRTVFVSGGYNGEGKTV